MVLKKRVKEAGTSSPDFSHRPLPGYRLVVVNNGRQSKAPCELRELVVVEENTDRSATDFGTLQSISGSFSSTKIILPHN
jgi:hypothetical protein